MSQRYTSRYTLQWVMSGALWLWMGSLALAQSNCGTQPPKNYQVGKPIEQKDIVEKDPGPNGIPGEGINKKSPKNPQAVDPEDLSVRSRAYVLYLAIHVLGKRSKENVEYDQDFKNMLKKVNAYYKKCNIGFIAQPFHYIHHSRVKFQQKERTSERFFRKHHRAGAINVFFVDTLYSPQGKKLTGIGSFPEALRQNIDRIVIVKSAALRPIILAHELGHYFGLLHTHETAKGKELVDRSNCRNTGDLLCDTPADPNLYTTTDPSTCQYTGAHTDANKERYTPEVGNLMSYAPERCRQTFSQGQCHRMRQRLLHQRAYLQRLAPKNAQKKKVQSHYIPLQWKHPFREKLSDLVQQAIHRRQNKILILVGHPLVNWSRRLKAELAHTPDIAQVIQKNYAYASHEVGNERSFLQLSNDNFWIGQPKFYQELRQILHPGLARVPSLVIIRFDYRQGRVTRSARIQQHVLGYRKPSELRKILGINARFSQ